MGNLASYVKYTLVFCLFMEENKEDKSQNKRSSVPLFPSLTGINIISFQSLKHFLFLSLICCFYLSSLHLPEKIQHNTITLLKDNRTYQEYLKWIIFYRSAFWWDVELFIKMHFAPIPHWSKFVPFQMVQFCIHSNDL